MHESTQQLLAEARRYASKLVNELEARARELGFDSEQLPGRKAAERALEAARRTLSAIEKQLNISNGGSARQSGS